MKFTHLDGIFQWFLYFTVGLFKSGSKQGWHVAFNYYVSQIPLLSPFSLNIFLVVNFYYKWNRHWKPHTKDWLRESWSSKLLTSENAFKPLMSPDCLLSFNCHGELQCFLPLPQLLNFSSDSKKCMKFPRNTYRNTTVQWVFEWSPGTGLAAKIQDACLTQISDRQQSSSTTMSQIIYGVYYKAIHYIFEIQTHLAVLGFFFFCLIWQPYQAANQARILEHRKTHLGGWFLNELQSR